MKNIRILWLIVSIYAVFLFPSYASSITFHRIGEGNCTTIAIDQKDGSKKYMVIDCGASEINKTVSTPTDIQTTFTPQKPRYFLKFPQSVEKEEPRIAIAQSGVELNQKKALSSIRKALGEVSKKRKLLPISVKTVVISHPDKDHFSWIWDVVDPQKGDRLENIVLGGRPEKYLKNSDFKEWLIAWLEKGKTFRPKVFFLAIKGFEVTTANDLEALENGEYALAPSLFSDPNRQTFNLILTRVGGVQPLKTELEEAFDFGDGALFQFLTINPVHIPSNIEEGTYIRLSYSPNESKDIDNQDSLIMKIINPTSRKSVVISGDATALTMERVFSNYLPKELKTDILLASHHGADTWGSNNQKLFEILQPAITVFSNGQHLSYNHPRETAYQNAREYALITDPHEITRYEKYEQKKVKDKKGGKVKKEKGHYATYKTPRAIFSTFDNGSIQIILDNNPQIININTIDYLEDKEKSYSIYLKEDEQGEETKREVTQEDVKEKEIGEEEVERKEAKKEIKEKPKRIAKRRKNVKIADTLIRVIENLSENDPIFASPPPPQQPQLSERESSKSSVISPYQPPSELLTSPPSAKQIEGESSRSLVSSPYQSPSQPVTSLRKTAEESNARIQSSEDDLRKAKEFLAYLTKEKNLTLEAIAPRIKSRDNPYSVEILKNIMSGKGVKPQFKVQTPLLELLKKKYPHHFETWQGGA